MQTLGRDQSDYDSGNFNWEIALVPDKELEWLRQELHEGKEPVIIFIHQLLDKGSGLYEGLYVKNAEQVNQVLIESQRVLAVFKDIIMKDLILFKIIFIISQ